MRARQRACALHAGCCAPTCTMSPTAKPATTRPASNCARCHDSAWQAAAAAAVAASHRAAAAAHSTSTGGRGSMLGSPATPHLQQNACQVQAGCRSDAGAPPVGAGAPAAQQRARHGAKRLHRRQDGHHCARAGAARICCRRRAPRRLRRRWRRRLLLLLMLWRMLVRPLPGAGLWKKQLSKRRAGSACCRKPVLDACKTRYMRR